MLGQPEAEKLIYDTTDDSVSASLSDSSKPKILIDILKKKESPANVMLESLLRPSTNVTWKFHREKLCLEKGTLKWVK
jgi:hypothetical protein